MAKLLAVKGHPLTSNESKSLKGLEVFIEAYKAAHPEDEVEFLDVFSVDIPELDADILAAWGVLGQGGDFASLTASQQDKLGRYNQFTEQFLGADKVVIASPLWNMMIPASLKKWIDTVMVAGKTFKYTAEGPVGLIKDKKILHLQANGSVYQGNDPSSQYVKAIFQFIGAQVSQIFVEGADADPQNKTAIVEEFLSKVRSSAADF